MRLLLMRHGIAAPVGGKIRSDAERPLTAEGRDKSQQVAQGLRAAGEAIGLIATSPQRRAVDTGAIVHVVYASAKPDLTKWAELEYAERREMLKRLRHVPADGAVLLVGHEPGLSRLAAELLTGSPTGFALDFKKAAVCALDLPRLDEDARATLIWFATPKLLRVVGGE